MSDNTTTVTGHSQILLSSLPVGTRLHEYEVERVLGQGGFGITYLARDKHLDKKVAIKEYLPNDLAARAPDQTVGIRSPDNADAFKWGLDNFIKEARVLGKFAHPSLIQVHRYFEANHTAYFVMEYAEGVTLASILKNEGTLSEEKLRKILFPILNGLEEVHRLGVLHRDIKPDNIILRREGSLPVLIDFGAAKQNLSSMTRSVMSVLTAGYAPIEQYATTGNQGPWTDLYAVGAVAYRALSGKKPIDAVNRIRDDPMISATMLGQGRYAPHFLAAIDWVMSVNPEDRPQSVADFKLALDGVLPPPAMGAPAPSGTSDRTPLYAPRVETPITDTNPTVMTGKVDLGALPAAKKPAGLPVPALIGTGAIVAVAAVLFFLHGQQAAPPAPAPAPMQTAKPAETAASTPSTATPTPSPAPAATTAPAPAPAAPQTQAQTQPAAPAPKPASGTPTAKPQVAAAAPARQPATVAAKPAATETTKPAAAAPAPAPVAAAPVTAAPAKSTVAPVAQMPPLAPFQDCPDCPAMVPLPAGKYQMGAQPADKGNPWEGPPHNVTLAAPFAIGSHEVTVAQWAACVTAKACTAVAPGPASGDAAKAPVVNINWTDAQGYVKWLSAKTGRSYRLPTESEWEYAIRARTGSARYWGGDRTLQCRYGNGADLSALKRDKTLPAAECDDHFAALAPVGSFEPNAFGLYDMAGNAWEWVEDCWKDSYNGVPADGHALEYAGCDRRVIRGGSWRARANSLRSFGRASSPPETRSDDLGLRVVAQ